MARKKGKDTAPPPHAPENQESPAETTGERDSLEERNRPVFEYMRSIAHSVGGSPNLLVERAAAALGLPDAGWVMGIANQVAREYRQGYWRNTSGAVVGEEELSALVEKRKALIDQQRHNPTLIDGLAKQVIAIDNRLAELGYVFSEAAGLQEIPPLGTGDPIIKVHAWIRAHAREFEVDPGVIDVDRMARVGNDAIRHHFTGIAWEAERTVLPAMGLMSLEEAERKRRLAELEAEEQRDRREVNNALHHRAGEAYSGDRISSNRGVKTFTWDGEDVRGGAIQHIWTTVARYPDDRLEAIRLVRRNEWSEPTMTYDESVRLDFKDRPRHYRGIVVKARGEEWVMTGERRILSRRAGAAEEVGAGGKPVTTVAAGDAKELGKKITEYAKGEIREWFGGQKAAAALYKRLADGAWLLVHDKEVVQTFEEGQQRDAFTAFWRLHDETKKTA